MRQITGSVEHRDKVRRQVPWAGPISQSARDEKFSSLIVLEALTHVLAFMYAVIVA